MGSSLSALSFVMSTVALVASVTTFISVRQQKDPLGKGIQHYDFSTPKASLVSAAKMQLEKDLRAMLELDSLTKDKPTQEMLRTLEVRKEAEWKGTKILFIAYERDGVKQFDVRGFEKHADTGFWFDHSVSSWGIRESNKQLADMIDSWNKDGSLGEKAAR